MDTALILRIAFDRGKDIGHNKIMDLLNSSKVVNELTADFVKKPLYAVWRIIALSEIPYAGNLDYTKQAVDYLEQYLVTGSGFALSGKETDLLPCYNAMLAGALSKLGHAYSECVQRAVGWIKNHQPFERNTTISWKGNGVRKYGGCLKATPCFIGIAKSVKALIYYSDAVQDEDVDVKKLIEKGMDYILKHELYKRLSNHEPITKHILDLAFPASYQLNIVELLEMAYLTGHIRDNRCKSAIEYVNSKKKKNNYWKVNYVYKADGYISFDKRGERGDWTTYLLDKFTSV